MSRKITTAVQTLAPFSCPIGCTAEAMQHVHHQERRAVLPRHESERLEPVLREAAWADPLTVGSLPVCILGRDGEKRARLLRISAPLSAVYGSMRVRRETGRE
jgi:hypothetical protein